MDDKRWFYRDDDEFNTLVEQLKLTPCPHCKLVGALIRHGSLYGFDENSNRKTLRARRIYCSNRKARPGCGRTFSIWLANKVRRLGLTTTGLWRFLQGAVANGILAAIRASPCRRSERTLQRLWQRFKRAQCKLRSALFARCTWPQPPAEHQPEAEVLAHLHAAFPDAPCPIAAFQHTLRTFFV